MTDLEKLAEQVQERIEKSYQLDNPLSILSPAERREAIILSALETARAAGRIEGLKEAMRNVCILCREGKVISDDHFHPMIMAVGQIHYELCQASRIHAIVRELEGNK